MTKKEVLDKIKGIEKLVFDDLRGIDYGRRLMVHLSSRELKFALHHAIFFEEGWIKEANKQRRERGTPLERILWARSHR